MRYWKINHSWCIDKNFHIKQTEVMDKEKAREKASLISQKLGNTAKELKKYIADQTELRRLKVMCSVLLEIIEDQEWEINREAY